jgi:hypothetical protein
MSVFNVFEEELLAYLKKNGFDVSKDTRIRYEVVGKNSLKVYLLEGLEVIIKDPWLINLAKAGSQEVYLSLALSRKELLGRLYALKVLSGEELEFSKFEKEYAPFSNQKLLEEIRKYEEKFKEENEKLKEYLETLVAGAMLRKAKGIPVGLDEILKRKTTHELAELYYEYLGKESIPYDEIELLL